MSPNVPVASPDDASNTTAPVQFIETRLENYAFRSVRRGATPPFVRLQHFTGTLDNGGPPSPTRWPAAAR